MHDRTVRTGDSGAKQIDRLLFEIASAFGSHQHAGRAPIGYKAAISDRQGVADHPALQDILDRKRSSSKGFRVAVGPFSRRNGDRGEILSGGAILVHVSGGRHRVSGDRVTRPIGRFVPLRLAQGDEAAAGRSLVRPVGDQRHVAQPGPKGRRGLEEMDLERRAANVRSLDVARLEAEIFGDRQGGHAVHARRREDAIHVCERDARVANRRNRGLAEKFDRRAARGFASPSRRHAHDRRLSPQSLAHLVACSATSKTIAGSSSIEAIRALTLVPICAVSTPSIRDISRGPSASSTSATL